jgi:Tfp pilus assembly protein PilE
MLAEVLLAMVVVVIAILAIVVCVVFSERLTRQASMQAVACDVARQKLESLRNEQFANRTAVTAASFTVPAYVTTAFAQYNFSGSYNIVATSSTLQQIVVRVAWTDADNVNGPVSQVRLDTFVASGANP